MSRFLSTILLSSILSLSLLHSQGATGSCVTQTYVPPKNNFVLVIDRSGSMAGGPLQAAKQGALNFINSLKAGDECALIAFDDRIKVLTDLTSDKRFLAQRIHSISKGGQTALYDAIAKSVSTLHGVNGAQIIVYMTDGMDTGSKFRLKDLESMNIVEGILVYGLGYGSVDQKRLAALSEATGGEFAHAKTTNRLTDIYSDVLNKYYSSKGQFLSDRSQLSVRSIPPKMTVEMDGQPRGQTPLNIEDLTPGNHQVAISFPKGGKPWECDFVAKPSHRIVIDARESDLGHSLRIASNPKEASVFIDGVYVGMTSIVPVPAVKVGKKKKAKAVKDFSKELEIPYLLPGKHSLRLIAMPDFDFGGSQLFEFEFLMGSTGREVEVNIFGLESTFTDGEVIKVERDPFEELDSQFK